MPGQFLGTPGADLSQALAAVTHEHPEGRDAIFSVSSFVGCPLKTSSGPDCIWTSVSVSIPISKLMWESQIDHYPRGVDMSWPKARKQAESDFGCSPHSLQRGDPPGPSSLGSMDAGCILGAICYDYC